MSVLIHRYEVDMLKLSDKIIVEIPAESDVARDTFFKHFLTHKEERFFKDANDPNIQYNKDYIYSFKYLGVK